MSLRGSRAWCWFCLGPGKSRVHEGPRRGFLSDAALMVGEREEKVREEGGRSSHFLRNVCVRVCVRVWAGGCRKNGLLMEKNLDREWPPGLS